ncbi:MAG: RHS repeat-associated core domain-containing protein, partial [Candidatus Sulfotelmatobacter sp.]
MSEPRTRTKYTYDALHRKTSVTYPYGPNSSNTPSKYFVYDSATVNSIAMANAKARLAEAYTCVSTCSSKVTDEGFSYTVRGEVQDVYESTPHSGGYFHVDETYWANGALDQVSGLSGLPTLTYAPDGEGRAKTVSASSGQNPVSGTTYNVASKAAQVNLGSGDDDAFSFDPNTFRMTQYQFNVNSNLVTGKLTWNANGSLESLDITDAFNSANTQNCAYTHDDLSRIASANCGSVWSQTFSYDAFGNLTKTGNSQFQPGYNYQTNQMSSGASYDSNGDVLSDSLHGYAWDVMGRPTTIDSVTVTYDALGRMAEQNKSGSYTEIVYAPMGNKLALMSGTSTLKQAFVPLPAGAVAVYNSSGLAYYRHPDWLGSSRFSSTPTRTMYNDLAFAPFGEPYAQAGSTDISFTGQNQDTTTNLYDFPAREYGIQGRWPSPDPAGLGAAHLRNPQTLNRYAYVAGRPLKTVDPLGTDFSGDDGFDIGTQDCDEEDCFLDDSGGGGGGDGSWDFSDDSGEECGFTGDCSSSADGDCSDSDSCDADCSDSNSCGDDSDPAQQNPQQATPPQSQAPTPQPPPLTQQQC